MATIGPLMLIGSMLGPLVGGMITTWLNWHFIFFLNVPLGLLAIFAIYHYFPKSKTRRVAKFDYLGFLILGSGLLLTLFAIDTIVDINIHSIRWPERRFFAKKNTSIRFF